ncbi:MAG: hypothetical protein Alpg2KO_26260 [Alphaproteobacteria bacterium]
MTSIFLKSRKQRGATTSGYGLIVGLVAIIGLAAVTSTGGNVTQLFNDVGDSLSDVAEVNFSISPSSASNMDISSGPAPASSNPILFTIRNNSGVQTGEIRTTMLGDPNFQVEADGCAGKRLEGGTTCTIRVSAVASANGAYSGSVRVGTVAKFAVATLSGQASNLTPASVSVNQPSVSGMDVADTGGSPSSGTPVTLIFTNDGDLTTEVLTTSNDNPTNFAITNDTCDGQTLASSSSCEIEVTPQASTNGSITASVGIGDGGTSASSSLSGSATGFSLFGFTSHTFNNCGATGRFGPTLSQCRSTYSPSGNWDEDNAHFSQGTYQGYQLWTVPETGNYQITVAGARGGLGDSNNANYRGDGRVVRGTFALTEGQQLTIVVGQIGQDRHNNQYRGGGGGGGTFVALGANASSATILAVGGGGGGAPDGDTWGYQAPSNGQNDGLTTHYGDTSRSVGGYRGDGASISDTGYSQYTTSQPSYNALSFRDGLRGGLNSSCYVTFGGFGGGGTPHCHNGGGGGGYSGGAGGNWADDAGEGGGSYVSNTATNPSTNQGLNSGHGYVTIQKL